jgi:plasmid maintenance system antidote protein VapI
MARIRTYPGEVLREEFNDAARPFRQCARVGIAGACDPIGDILRIEEPRAVSTDLTICLARHIGMTPDFRLNLHAAYDLSLLPAEHEAASSATFTRARS